MKMEAIDLCNFGVTWGILGFFNEFYDEFLSIFFYEFFLWIFLTNFLRNVLANVLTIFFMNFLKDFLTYNLLSIASFKIGVPLISSLHFRLLHSGFKGLQCAQEALFPFF